MVRKIQAKTLLSHRKEADGWFGLKYNMNLYRGCAHGCIYCDSRSDCYQLGDLADIRIKANALDLLRKELASKRRKGYIGTGSMNDPYQPAEAQYGLTGQALRVIATFGFPVHIITKSDLVLKDLSTLQQINRYAAAVSFTLTTVDDELASKLEPGAPPPSARLRAMQTLAQAGVPTGVTMMPILPFIQDTEQNIRAIIEAAVTAGASYVLPALGVTLRAAR